MTDVRTRTKRLPREVRREQLLDVTTRVIVERGFGGLSMETIAREADVAKTVVYSGFGDLDGVLRALMARTQERVEVVATSVIPSAEDLGGDPAALITATVERYLEAVVADPLTWRLILIPADGTPPAIRELVEEGRERYRRRIEPAIAWVLAQVGAADVDARLITHLGLANADELARLALTHPRRYSPRKLAATTAQLLDLVSA